MDWSILKESMQNESLWIIIFCVLVSPIGLGYLTTGFFYGFEPLNINHVVIGAFLAAPLLFCSFLFSRVGTQIDNFEIAIKKKKGINYAEQSEDIIRGAFLLHAMFSWSIIAVSLITWLFFGSEPLTKTDKSTVILLAFAFGYGIEISFLALLAVSKDKKFMKLKSEYYSLLDELDTQKNS